MAKQLILHEFPKRKTAFTHSLRTVKGLPAHSQVSQSPHPKVSCNLHNLKVTACGLPGVSLSAEIMANEEKCWWMKSEVANAPVRALRAIYSAQGPGLSRDPASPAWWTMIGRRAWHHPPDLSPAVEVNKEVRNEGDKMAPAQCCSCQLHLLWVNYIWQMTQTIHDLSMGAGATLLMMARKIHTQIVMMRW